MRMQQTLAIRRSMLCLAVAILLTGPARTVRADEAKVKIQGRVVDSEENPVANADVTTYWSANGVPRDRLKELLDKKDVKALWSHEGDMRPWGDPVVTDANGRFEAAVNSADIKVLAINKQRTQGGIGRFDTSHSGREVVIRLQPLIRVQGTLEIAGTGRKPEWSAAMISLAFDPKFPLGRYRLAVCGSFQGRFDFLLPPGRYLLFANSDSEDAASAKTFPEVDIELRGDERNVDLGVVKMAVLPTTPELVLQKKDDGSWKPLADRFGQNAPPLDFNDVRGVPEDFRLTDLKGKWVVVYFWGPWCRPCLKDGLPALAEFYRKHESKRDRFEVVSICIDKDAELSSMKQLENHLAPVVKNVWKADIPFPILLDNSFRSFETWGIEAVGVSVLIDPQGRIVEGDATSLAELLRGESQ